MKLTDGTQSPYSQQMLDLYYSAFPPEELTSVEFLREMKTKGECEILAILKDKTFIGLAITFHEEVIPFLAYFAISPELRGRGYGSKAFQILKERYGDIVLEIETTYDREHEDYPMRLSRKAFYIKNELKAMPFTVNCFGVEMELMTTRQRVRYSDYFEIYENVFGTKTTEENIELETILL